MQQLHRKKCVDASVMRGAECHIDHQLLRIKVMTDQRTYHQRTLQSRERGRFAVDGLHGGRRRKEENSKMQDFQRQVSDAVKTLWPSVESGMCELKWTVIKIATVDVAKESLGVEIRRQTDWYRESSESLEPLLQRRSSLYSKWLASGGESDRSKFAKARYDARRAVREAKNAWFQARVAESKRGRFSGKKAWQCI